MFGHVFLYIFESDVVFPKTKEREVVMLILGGPNIAISLSYVTIRTQDVFKLASTTC